MFSRITVKAFYDKIESNDSNTVITRVKKLSNKIQKPDNSLNKSDHSVQQNSTSSVEEKKTMQSPPLSPQLHQAIPKIMDKLRANSPTSTMCNQLPISNNNDRQYTSPKKDKNLHYTLLKERLLEKQNQTRQNPDDEFHDLSSKISKNPVEDKSRSHSHSPEEFINESAQLPFSNSTNFIQNRAKQASKAISIITNNKTKDLNKYFGSPKELSTLVDYKPPISPSTPPRIPSPTQFSSLISPVKINNTNMSHTHSPTSNLYSSKASIASYGFEVINSQNKSLTVSLLPGPVNVSKHKQSKSVDLSLSLNKLKHHSDNNEEELSSNNTTNTHNNNSYTSNNSLITTTNNSSTTKNILQKTLIIKSAKFSISEPNLSASVARSEASGGGGNSNSNPKLDFVRQSLSFDEDDTDDDIECKLDNPNNLVINNKENEQNLINVNRAQRIFKSKLLDQNNLISKVNV